MTVALYDVDPDTIAALVVSCPAVAGLSGGPFGAAATYLPGRKVPGVRITPTAVEVHVVAQYGVPLPVLAGQVRRVLEGQVAGRAVDIVVEDLTDPPGNSTGALGTASGGPVASAVDVDVGWPPPTLPPPTDAR